MQKLRIAVYITPANYVNIANYISEHKLKNEGQAINAALKEYFEQSARLQRTVMLLQSKLQEANDEIELLKRRE